MATKSKSKFIKLTALILLFTYGLSGLCTMIVTGGEYFKSYFHTNQFHNEYEQYIGYLALFELEDLTKEEAKQSITVSDEEIEEHRYRHGELSSQIESIKEQYHNQIEEATTTSNGEVADIYRAERDAKIADIKKNFESDDHVREKIVKEKTAEIDQYFADREQYRERFGNYQDSFLYYLKNRSTGEVITNTGLGAAEPLEEIINDKTMLYIQVYPDKHGLLYANNHGYQYVNYNETIERITDGLSFEGMVGVPKSAPAASVIKSQYESYQAERVTMLIFAGTSFLALLFVLIFRKWASVWFASEARLVSLYKRIPIDVRVLVFGGTAFLGLISFIIFHDSLMYLEWDEIILAFLLEFMLLFCFYFQGKWLFKAWQGTMDSNQEWKSAAELDEEWKRSWTYRLFALLKRALLNLYLLIKEVFLNRSLGGQMVILLAAVFSLGASAVIVLIQPLFIIPFGLVGIVGVFALVSLLKYTGYFNKIVANTDELAAGRMGEDLPVDGKSVFDRLAANINILKHGVKKSQTEQAKSERLKTELITNVSHDLRTPLTSIITYSELLKAPDLSESDRTAYIEIIDRKSKRLKVLIDDLFEASKMASGSVELTKDRVDLVQLLQQALAEYNEAIEEAGLHMRIVTPEQPVIAFVDGQKLWRVFDNLIGNILKYSLENTRVFITLKTSDNQAVLTFKNVTKYELSESVDELFERFKRGDESRNTDGSGLGLAIAKSIVDLHDGDMDIEVDGDLFKVTIKLDLLD